LKDDIEEKDLNRPEMMAKLICTLETAMNKPMQENRISQLQAIQKFLLN
tara:strand:- start:462 stop:608 length:147 start_codon:yes stop_codon:yes gene_type:complete